MASVTLSVDGDVATWSSGIAAGAGDHLPVGDYGSADYRSAIRYDAPAWSGWTAITKATLTFYISDFKHVGPRNSSIYVSRQAIGSLWTKGEGSQDCESGFSASNNTQYGDISPSSTNRKTFSSGTTENAKKSLTVTDLVQYYKDQNASKIVFVFDNAGSGDYTELWSKGKLGGYNAELVIEYEVQSPPVAPTLVAPASAAVSTSQTPTFSWTHSDPQGDAQTSAEVRIYDAAGTTLLYTWPVAGAAASLVAPTALTRGSSYRWAVRTADAAGFGPLSGQRTFSIKALPVVTIDATRYLEYSGGAPRLRVKWSADQAQVRYRIQTTSPTSDTGFVTSTAQSVLLTGVTLINGTAINVTVTVEAAASLQGGAARSFTPRWGVTVHRRDLATIPTGWGTPLIASTVPAGSSVIVEYGSSATATATPSPNTWYSSLSSVPKQRYVFYRATLIPSATTGPSLDKITIPANFVADVVDHWYGTLTGGLPSGPLPAPWSIDAGEYVYGTRSVSRDGNGAVGFAVSERIKVRAGRSYILTGLMKSEGNSQSTFGLFDPDTNTYVETPEGAPVQSETLASTRDWFSPDRLDTYRYRTPIFVAPADIDVVVRLRMAGAAGTSAWWDGIKLEESTVATPWGPSAVGAVTIDAGGVQVDGTKGGVFRGRGSAGGQRDVVTLGSRGLLFGDGLHIYAASSNELYLDGSANGSSAQMRILSGASAPGVYSALLTAMGGDTVVRAVFGRSGDVNRTGMFLGPGTATRDTNLYRSAASQLTTDGALIVSGGLTAPNFKGAVALQFVGNGTVTGTGVVDLGWGGPTGTAQFRLGYAGSVVGIAIALNTTRTAGTLSAQVYNSSGANFVGPVAVIDATNTQYAQATGLEGAVGSTFGPTSLLRCRLTGAGFTPTAVVATVIVYVTVT